MQKYSLHINFVHKVCRIIDYGNLFCPLSGKEKRNCFIWSLCVSDDWVFVSNVFLERMGCLSTPRSFRQNVPFIIYPSWCVCVCVCISDQICDEFPSIKEAVGHLWLLWTNFYRQSRTNRGVVWLLLNRTIQKTRRHFPFAWHIY